MWIHEEHLVTELPPEAMRAVYRDTASWPRWNPTVVGLTAEPFRQRCGPALVAGTPTAMANLVEHAARVRS